MIAFDMTFDLPSCDKCSWTLWTLKISFFGVKTLDVISEMRTSQELFVTNRTLMLFFIVMTTKVLCQVEPFPRFVFTMRKITFQKRFFFAIDDVETVLFNALMCFLQVLKKIVAECVRA